MVDSLTLTIGSLEVLTTASRWDALRSQAPVPATSEDMSDYAIGELERDCERCAGLGNESVVWIEGEMRRALEEGDEAAALDWADVLNVIEREPERH